MAFDYDAPAELFLAKRTKRRREKYRRFATAAEAIRYAVENLRTLRSLGAWMEVGDERFNGDAIQRLYDDRDYPLSRTHAMRAVGPFFRKDFHDFNRPRGFKKAAKGSGVGYDLKPVL